MNPPPTSDDAILDSVLREEPARRALLLRQLCGEDGARRLRLEARLAAREALDELLEDRVAPAPGTIVVTEEMLAPISPAPAAADPLIGSLVGPYKLREKLGEGGHGLVYAAEQSQPVRRKVAVKIIKMGMDTKEVIARFAQERQALAMMDHPNIARVLDAGATDQGRPYFVMELVRGVRITEYCDRENLDTEARIRLFIAVCQAVQHAHQKGIIHRDIKPSNILVTLHDGVPVPKVIDFGIAKATEGRLTDLTVYTEVRQFMGTPAYMSPEQAEMSGLDIDTRSDIYSLGVLLYELLSGSLPFSTDELLAAGVEGMRKVIREKEPARPSTRLATMGGEEQTTVARKRGLETSKLVHRLRGDLDWIVIKCLEKDRNRRYATSNGLAADLTRHLSDEPVVARPPSTIYLLWKATRRNRAAFTTLAAVLLALSTGLGIALQQYDAAKKAKAIAVRERQSAESSEREQARQRAIADAKAKGLDAMAGILRKMIEALLPLAKKADRPEDLLSILRLAGMNAKSNLAGEPRLASEIYRLVGENLYHAGNAEDAAPWLWAAYAGFKDFPERSTSLDYAEVLVSLAEKPGLTNRPIVEIAEEARDIFRRVLGPGDPQHARAQIALAYQIKLAWRQDVTEGRKDRARSAFLKAEEIFRGVLDELRRPVNQPVRPDILAHAYQELGYLYFDAERYSEASSIFEEGLIKSVPLELQNPHQLVYLEIGAARSFDRAGRLDEAMKHARLATSRVDLNFGAAHRTAYEAYSVRTDVAYRIRNPDDIKAVNEKTLGMSEALAAKEPNSLSKAILWAQLPLDHGGFDPARSLMLGWLRSTNVLNAAPAEAWVQAGIALARHAPWQGSGSLRDGLLMFAEARKDNSTQDEALFFELAAQAGLNDRAKFSSTSQETLSSWSKGRGGHMSARLATALLMFDCAPSTAREIGKSLKARGDESSPWGDYARALAMYRAGEFAEAVVAATDAMRDTLNDGDLRVGVLAVLAMSEHRMGRQTEATLRRDDARRLSTQLNPWILGEADNKWAEWTIAGRLLAEADHTLMATPTTGLERAE